MVPDNNYTEPQINFEPEQVHESIIITPIINSNKVSLTLDKNLAEALYKALKQIL